MDTAWRAPQAAGNSDTPLPASIVDQAIAWYVRLASGLQSDHDRRAFQAWHAAHPDHAVAWQRLHALGDRVQAGGRQVPPPLVRTTLARAERSAAARRRALKTLMWAGTGTGAIVLLRDAGPWRSTIDVALADVRTAVGERRELWLADGTRLVLNTATGVDVHFDDRQRTLVLRSGEIMIATAHDPLGRPFRVQTADGTLTPLGTRFTVRRADGDDATLLAVTEGRVEIAIAGSPSLWGSPAPVPHRIVEAGQQARFTRLAVEPSEDRAPGADSWVDGSITAERTRLGDFMTEVGRYRTGYLGCDAAIADLRLTGAWPLAGADATDRLLASLENTLPVKVRRVTRYWVRLVPR